MSVRAVAQEAAKKGRYGDTMLAHLTKKQAELLKARGGSGTINPRTGLPEYFDPVSAAIMVGGNLLGSFISSRSNNDRDAQNIAAAAAQQQAQLAREQWDVSKAYAGVATDYLTSMYEHPDFQMGNYTDSGYNFRRQEWLDNTAASRDAAWDASQGFGRSSYASAMPWMDRVGQADHGVRARVSQGDQDVHDTWRVRQLYGSNKGKRIDDGGRALFNWAHDRADVLENRTDIMGNQAIAQSRAAGGMDPVAFVRGEYEPQLEARRNLLKFSMDDATDRDAQLAFSKAEADALSRGLGASTYALESKKAAADSVGRRRTADILAAYDAAAKQLQDSQALDINSMDARLKGRLGGQQVAAGDFGLQKEAISVEAAKQALREGQMSLAQFSQILRKNEFDIHRMDQEQRERESGMIDQLQRQRANEISLVGQEQALRRGERDLVGADINLQSAAEQQWWDRQTRGLGLYQGIDAARRDDLSASRGYASNFFQDMQGLRAGRLTGDMYRFTSPLSMMQGGANIAAAGFQAAGNTASRLADTAAARAASSAQGFGSMMNNVSRYVADWASSRGDGKISQSDAGLSPAAQRRTWNP